MRTLYSWPCILVRVLDGDTVEVDVDLGFDISKRVIVRLNGVNAPETKGVEKPAGEVARGYVVRWFSACTSRILLNSFSLDKYGRALGDFVQATQTSEVVLSLCVSLSLAKVVQPYDGGARTPFTPEALARIVATSPV